MSARLERFLAFSAEVTAYPIFDLRGTGLAETHLAAVEQVVGATVLDALLDRYTSAVETVDTPAERADRLRRDIFSDPYLGPLARNLVKLWYVGIWYELPRTWTDAYGARPKDVTFTVSSAAYIEGLLWPSIGAHPPGAKAPGYGSWTQPPRIPAIP